MDAVSGGMAKRQRRAPGVHEIVPNGITKAVISSCSWPPVVHWLHARPRIQHGWKGNAGGTQRRKPSNNCIDLQGSEGSVEVFASTR